MSEGEKRECFVCSCDTKISSLTHGNQKYCDTHKEQTVRKKLDGWCGFCGARESKDGFKTCDKCRRYIREYRRERFCNDPEFRKREVERQRKYYVTKQRPLVRGGRYIKNNYPELWEELFKKHVGLEDKNT